MAKVNNRDRDVLARALRNGGVSVVTHRGRAEVPGGVDELRRLNALCAAGYLRQDRISGDRYSPVGELRYEYKLTGDGEQLARRGG
jgi:hypothetical protein